MHCGGGCATKELPTRAIWPLSCALVAVVRASDVQSGCRHSTRFSPELRNLTRVSLQSALHTMSFCKPGPEPAFRM
eukprot:8990557-Karenia_brevis.AAC.1